ncbi:MAG: hypothetical protein FWC89_14345 [Defluviitaleaceae bacterium]|nr:hypothetical protein [Defluviitaleaceae bacterium]
MNNEEKILSLLENQGKTLEALIQGQVKLEAEVKDIKLDMADVKQEITDVKQEITDVKQEITDVKVSLENKTNKNILKLVDGFEMHSNKLKKVDKMEDDIVHLKMDTSNLKMATKELLKKVAL